MTEEQFDSRIEAFLATQRDQPFGDTASVSGKTLSPFSEAGHEAARNLLAKARGALAAGDDERARGFVDRAVGLPFDRHEGVAPAAAEAVMALYLAVNDAYEQCEHDDPSWLDAALEVLETADDGSAACLRHDLVHIDDQHDVTQAEHRRITAAIAGVPPQPELTDLDLAPTELSERVLPLMRLVVAFEAAWESRRP